MPRLAHATRSTSERAHGLFAPWVLHTGLGPDAASSGFMAQVIAVAMQLGGMPVPRGGGVELVDALARRSFATPAARARPDATSSASSSRDGRATGVRTADGEVVERRAP